MKKKERTGLTISAPWRAVNPLQKKHMDSNACSGLKETGIRYSNWLWPWQTAEGIGKPVFICHPPWALAKLIVRLYQGCGLVHKNATKNGQKEVLGSEAKSYLESTVW